MTISAERPRVRGLWDSTSSCTAIELDDSDLDCGECAHCQDRVEAFTEACGEDRTRYVRKSPARKLARKGRLAVGQDVVLAQSMLTPLQVEPELAAQFPMQIIKVRHDGLYEVGLMRGGKLAAVGAFSRTALVKK